MRPWTPRGGSVFTGYAYNPANGTDDITVGRLTNLQTVYESVATKQVTVNNVDPDFEAGVNETLSQLQAGVFTRGPISFTDPGILLRLPAS